MSSNPREASSNLQFTCSNSCDTSWISRVTSSNQRVKSSNLQVTSSNQWLMS